MTTGLKARVDAKRARTADLAVREVTAAIAQVATGDVRETAPDMVSAESGARAVLPALVTAATGRPTTVTTVVPVVLLSTETTGRAVGRGLRDRVVTTSVPMVIATSPEAVPTEPVTAGTGRRSTVMIVVSVGRSTAMIVRVGSVVRTVTAISRVVSMVRVPIVVSAGRSTEMIVRVVVTGEIVRPSTVMIVVSAGPSTVTTVRVGSVRRSTAMIVVSVGRSTVMTVRVGSVVRTVTVTRLVAVTVRVPTAASAGRSTA
ncbi:hypothetical protein ACWCSH_48780, partial [Streptosporangium sp. NPDC001682]